MTWRCDVTTLSPVCDEQNGASRSSVASPHSLTYFLSYFLYARVLYMRLTSGWKASVYYINVILHALIRICILTMLS